MMLILVLFIGLQSILFNNAQIAEDLLQKQALGCHLRLYTYRVEQTDSSGRICWDNVSAMSCWGRCDSREVILNMKLIFALLNIISNSCRKNVHKSKLITGIWCH